ncbi:MAG TPA: hypothetical protein VM537_27100 [Anaerolineae bacterium]|nr:hypothetical protein [Anaerolineae bacterium]
MTTPNPTDPFRAYVVKRPDGGCQVLFPLSELDGIIRRVIETGTARMREVRALVDGARECSARSVRLTDLEKVLGL